MIDTLREKIGDYLNHPEDVESLHQLRVQTRRVLAQLSSKSSTYRQLKSLIKQTNAIRDLDVMLCETIPSLAASAQATLKENGIIAALGVEKERLEEDFMDVLKDFDLSSIAVTPKPPKKKKLAIIDLKKLGKGPGQQNVDERIHKFRLKAKRARYYIEHHLPNEKKRIKLLKKVQERLGKIHDYNVFTEKLETLMIPPEAQAVIQKELDRRIKRYLKQTNLFSRTLIKI